MGLRGFLSVFRIPHLLSVMKVSGDLRAYVRLNFLFAAFESGLLRALRTPATREEALGRIGAKRPELAEALLDLGVALGELSHDGRAYSLRGRRARAMAAESGDPLAAWVEENVAYHGDVYRNFVERMKGAESGRYLEAYGRLIARSSRVLEPMLAAFVREVVITRRPARLLEVGCGSGIYLRHAAEAHPKLVGVAIDVQQSVLDDTRANLARWGIAERFELVATDVLHPPATLAGPFDLVTLYNNVYYFDDGVRVGLFRRLRSWLSPGGALAIASALRGADPETVNFDLVLRSTAGCTPLPALATLTAQLRESGFGRIDTAKLGPGGSFYGLVASA
jgi:SAM-dependent methyltransferase